MNQATLHSNEFILRVSEDERQIRYAIVNPHTNPGNSGKYDPIALSAAYALLAMAGKIKRKTSHNDESDTELHP